MKKHILNYSIPTLLFVALVMSCTEADIESPPVANLSGMTKGYENNDGFSTYRENYTYDNSGRVHTVTIEQFPNGFNKHIDTYYYNTAGKIERINQYGNTDKVFLWQDSKITQSSIVVSGVTLQYSEFQYDVAGNLTDITLYSLQPDETYLVSYTFHYTYFQDGNLQEELTYAPDANGGENIFISRKTFWGYLSEANPFPIVVILPNVKTQKQLPTYYRHEAEGYGITYNMSYEFREDGKVIKRKMSSSYGEEVTQYSYY
jgi:hypothetical protein